MTSQQLQVPCPQCQKKIVWSSTSTWRPFCSERCQLIDFGMWDNEQFSLPADQVQRADSDDPETEQS